MISNIQELKEIIKNRNKAITLMIGNQKGGVGKTTNTYLIAYTLAKMGIKTLVADLDPQSNATKTLALTKSQNSSNIYTIDKTMMRGVQDGDLTDLPINIISNLDLLPSNTDFENFTKFLYKTTDDDFSENHLLEPLFEPLKNEYDIIILDTPPFSIEITRNAAVMSDYVIVSLQTEDDSLSGATEIINTLVKIKKQYDVPIEIIGILPMLSDKRGSVDKRVLEDAKNSFGEDSIFKIIVPRMARIKRFPINGITDKDKFDKKVLSLYSEVTNELIDRIIEFER